MVATYEGGDTKAATYYNAHDETIYYNTRKHHFPARALLRGLCPAMAGGVVRIAVYAASR
jgi:hypothetical protein